MAGCTGNLRGCLKLYTINMEDGGDAPRVTLGQMQLNKKEKDWFSRSLYLSVSPF